MWYSSILGNIWGRQEQPIPATAADALAEFFELIDETPPPISPGTLKSISPHTEQRLLKSIDAYSDYFRKSHLNNKGETALFLAAVIGSKNIVEKLLKIGADPNYTMKNNLCTGITALHAALSCYIHPKSAIVKEVVELLLQHGACPNAEFSQTINDAIDKYTAVTTCLGTSYNPYYNQPYIMYSLIKAGADIRDLDGISNRGSASLDKTISQIEPHFLVIQQCQLSVADAMAGKGKLSLLPSEISKDKTIDPSNAQGYKKAIARFCVWQILSPAISVDSAHHISRAKSVKQLSDLPGRFENIKDQQIIRDYLEELSKNVKAEDSNLYKIISEYKNLGHNATKPVLSV